MPELIYMCGCLLDNQKKSLFRFEESIDKVIRDTSNVQYYLQSRNYAC